MRKATRAMCRLDEAPCVSARRVVPIAAFCLCFLFAMRTPAQQPAVAKIGHNSKPRFTTFDAPGAATGAGQGTAAASVNTAGVIAGTYTTAIAVNGSFTHGFVRAANGTITSFDVSGIDTFATYAKDINAAGAITGCYESYQAGGGIPVLYGFVRAADGALTAFEVPGAGTVPDEGTVPMAINAGGAVTGYYTDANDVYHGFVRAADGTIISFDAPGAAGTLTPVGTVPTSINTGGVIAGYYSDVFSVLHGFVRAADGTITSFDASSAGSGIGSGRGTEAWNINTAGTIAGSYSDASGVDHGFVRAADGTVTSFDAPGAGTGFQQGTYAVSINTAGAVAGYYIGAKGRYHGFVRGASGAIATFEAPGAGAHAGHGGTYAAGISTAGAIAGYYWDANGMEHGFLLTP